MFNGKRKGLPISERQINKRLKKLGLQTHDGRRLALTEDFVHFKKQGLSKEDAMAAVKQLANHSERTSDQILEDAYLNAEIIARDAEYHSVSELRILNRRLSDEIDDLKKRLAECSCST